MTLEERKAARKASLNSWPSEPTTEFPGKEFGDGAESSESSSDDEDEDEDEEEDDDDDDDDEP